MFSPYYRAGVRAAIDQVRLRRCRFWTYALAEPLTLPKGTELEVTGWFDNSRNNKWNPDPTTEVF